MEREHEQNFITCTHDRFITIIVFTDGGGAGGWKIFKCKHFFCLCLPAKTVFYLHTINFISVFTASAYKLFQNFPTPPPPPTSSKQ